MRIITWNCKMALHKKIEALLSLKPDLAVVQECTQKTVKALEDHGYEAVWFGADPVKKGLGVVCRRGWSIRVLPRPPHKWVVPLEISAPIPFRLIAVWACRSEIKGTSDYIGQVHHALMSNPEWFDGKPVVLAGDLNSNKIWDKERSVGNHTDVVNVLDDWGLVSAYHEFHKEEQGSESRPTIYLHHRKDRPYHIDYIFIPREWKAHIRTVDVGNFEDWARLSDHCPVSVELSEVMSAVIA